LEMVVYISLTLRERERERERERAFYDPFKISPSSMFILMAKSLPVLPSFHSVIFLLLLPSSPFPKKILSILIFN